MSIIHDDLSEFLIVFHQASEFLLQNSVTPSYIQSLRNNFPHLDNDSITEIIDLALGTNKAYNSGEYKAVLPWLFSSKTYEQCSSPAICLHHMKRLQVENNTVLEICTGAGMDALAALAQKASFVYTIEAHKQVANLFELNCTLKDINHVSVIQSEAEITSLPKADILWADPSRREIPGKRKQLTGNYAPSIDWLLQIASAYKRAGIKIAPGEQIKGDFSREFISYNWECREQILWIQMDIPDGSVTLIDKNYSWYPKNSDVLPKLISPEDIQSGHILIEPNPALIRGALSACYAEFDIAVFDREIAFGIHKGNIDPHPLFRTFSIEDVFRFNRKELQSKITSKNWNKHTEIKKRGFPLLPEEIRKELVFAQSDHYGTIVLTRCGNEHWVILCKRI